MTTVHLLAQICLACTGFTALCAQPVVTAAAHLPMIGSTRTIYSANLSQDQPPGGADAVWDMSWLAAQGSSTVQYVTPASTPDGALFPDATLAIAAPGGEYRYLSVGPDGLVEHGTATLCTFVWNNTKILLPPVLNTGDDHIDDYGGFCDLGFGTLPEDGTYESFMDGWGTLIMPANTFSGVARVVSDRYFTLNTIDFHEVLHDYYVPDVPEPVLSCTRLFQIVGGSESQLAYNANFIVEPGTGLDEASGTVGFVVTPDGIGDGLALQALAGAPVIDAYKVFDAQGRCLFTGAARGEGPWPITGDRHALDVLFVQPSYQGVPRCALRVVGP